MHHPCAPVKLARVKLESEGRLGIVVSSQVKIMQFVDISGVQLQPRDVILVEPEQVDYAGHPPANVVVPLQCSSVVQQSLQQTGH